MESFCKYLEREDFWSERGCERSEPSSSSLFLSLSVSFTLFLSLPLFHLGFTYLTESEMVKKIESRVEIRVSVQGRKNSRLNMNKSRSHEVVSSLSLSLYLLTVICSLLPPPFFE